MPGDGRSWCAIPASFSEGRVGPAKPAEPQLPEEEGRMHKLRRLPSALALVLVLAPPAAALAQDYPARPVRLIIPFTAGSATDLLARRIAVKMSDNWGQQVVIDN